MNEQPSGRHIPLDEMILKKGVVKTPFNASLQNVVANPWRENRLIEYLWMAIILEREGPGNGLRKILSVFHYIKTKKIALHYPTISNILNMDSEDEKNFFEYICKEKLDYAFLPFVVVAYDNRERHTMYDIFLEMFLGTFLERFMSLDVLLKKFENIIVEYLDARGDKATYLRFCALSLDLSMGDIVLQKGRDDILVDQFVAISEGNSFKLNPMIASTVRAMELSIWGFHNENPMFTKDFDDFTSKYVYCDIKMINQGSEKTMEPFEQVFKELSINLKKTIAENHSLMISSRKFQVMTASLEYGLRIFKEVNVVGFDSVVAVESMRSILETFINNKFLLDGESEREDIWLSYQKYGGSALRKLAAESDKYSSGTEVLPKEYDSRLIHLLSTEIEDELVGDIDLRYFENTNIRKKFQKVDLESLYHTYYEYGTQFTHGYWSAVRLATTDFCDQPLHQSHSNTELNEQVPLKSAFDDYAYILSLWSDMFFGEFPVSTSGEVK